MARASRCRWARRSIRRARSSGCRARPSWARIASSSPCRPAAAERRRSRSRSRSVRAADTAERRASYTCRMGRTELRLLSAFAAVAVLLMTPPVRAAAPVDRIWFCPDPGTLDYIDLFTHPEEWPHAGQLMDVFKVYQQHTQLPPAPIVGPNTFDALARAGAFQTLTRWGKKIAIEAGAVKEFYCTPDASGMNAAIGNTNDSIQRVEGAGATVSYIAMDEPFVSGRSRACGGPALEPTADRVATYVSGVTAARPKIRIGLIEAYPFSSASAIQTIIQLLKARNATPAFLHMDVDWHLSGSAAFKRDMAVLQG